MQSNQHVPDNDAVRPNAATSTHERAVGLFTAHDGTASKMEHNLAELGVAPKIKRDLEFLAQNPDCLNQLDSAVIHVTSKGKTSDLVADAVAKHLENFPNFFCLIFVPSFMLEEAWRFFYGQNVQIIVDPNDTDMLSGLLHLYHMQASQCSHLETNPCDSALPNLAGELRNSLMEIAAKIDRLSSVFSTSQNYRSDQASGADSAFRFGEPASGSMRSDAAEKSLLNRPKPPLPDARLVRQLIQERKLRGRFLDPALFADPAWDMLLDLTAARVERKRVSVTSLCIASGVAPTTALRWIGDMISAGLLERQQDDVDRRRAFIALSDKAAEAIARYFAARVEEAALRR